MDIFNVISLLGGLAMFLYGMRLMGDSLKENSSGTLKAAMGKVTDNPLKAFILGVLVTALIQSSTATIVITAGLVGAGILTLHQSLGIIIGANVGTTVTGQIIRLLDIDASGIAKIDISDPSFVDVLRNQKRVVICGTTGTISGFSPKKFVLGETLLVPERPDGVPEQKWQWAAKVMQVNGKNCICVTTSTQPLFIRLR